jgi:DNA (cytosine-5)-methyltransferase 1
MSRGEAGSIAGLFAGIGGLEVGLGRAGFSAEYFCEIDTRCQAVLRSRFPDVELDSDIQKVKRLPSVDVVAAGFPCQDLSVAGKRAGIDGSRSGLVDELLRLIAKKRTANFRWLVIENVPYMLGLDKGKAMSFLTAELEALGFTWAYRVVDVRSFGVPQRRRRVYLVASRTEDPRQVLFADEYGLSPVDDATEPQQGFPYGFYWTEGLRGVGWTQDSVPPIKGGSGLGIPSAPALWLPSRRFIGTIDICDAERLQGFPANWTQPAEQLPNVRPSARWQLVGNAVCAEVAAWIGKRLANPGTAAVDGTLWKPSGSWPKAAWGSSGKMYKVEASQYPVRAKYRRIESFLKHPLKPLSERATRGYLDRARRCWWYVSPKFLADVEAHLQLVSAARA